MKQLENYWPSQDEVRRCIRKEAEELSDHVLIAVHEPMILAKQNVGNQETVRATESELLAHLMEAERPIPIIGESGVGKSHIIRWLDIQLRGRKEAENWHICRIPKNASLRRVLEILLEGLGDEEFVRTLADVRRVGDEIRVEEVADFLLLAMGHRLQRLAENAEKERQALKGSGVAIQEEEAKRYRSIRQHASGNCLPVLINDPEFRKILVAKGRCVHAFAERIVSGSTEEKIASYQFSLASDDLNFSMNLDDLSGPARNYARRERLNTSEEKRKEATDLLNEILNEACSDIFGKFFQLNCGSFQQLFGDIRKYLHSIGKTLIILVEDMAAISAIEDVLVDSLLEESTRDGQQSLCVLKSAIAVTTGYAGYQKRRNTLATRAGYEWKINRFDEDHFAAENRIVEFCGRYLNAVRWGEDALQHRYRDFGNEPSYPGIWESEETEERDLAKDLGTTQSGIPLFPYSKAAISALARKHCMNPQQEQLEFNPRNILNKVLRDFLDLGLPMYEQGVFPGPKMFDIACPGSLEREIQQEVIENTNRSVSFAAIWGHGARSIAELRGCVKSLLVGEFGLLELQSVLEGKGEVVIVEAPPPRSSGVPSPAPPIPPPVDEFDQISEEVDRYFEGDRPSIPQSSARILRSELFDVLGERGKYWVELSGMRNIPELRHRGNIIRIEIPFSGTNPDFLISLAKEEDVLQEPSRIKGFIVAVLRKDKARKLGMNDWSYPGVEQDYFRYMHFLEGWLPTAIRQLVALEREKAADRIKTHYKTALLIKPVLQGYTNEERISFLCTAPGLVKESVHPTEMAEWDACLKNAVNQWEKLQSAWVDLFSRNRHALEGDLLKKLAHGLEVEMPANSALSVASNCAKDLKTEYSQLGIFRGCSRADVFEELLIRLKTLVTEINDAGQFQGMPEGQTSRKLRNRIDALVDGEGWAPLKSFLEIYEGSSRLQLVASLQGIRIQSLEKVADVAQRWSSFYENNYARMKEQNLESGGDKRAEREQVVESHLNELAQLVETLKGQVLEA